MGNNVGQSTQETLAKYGVKNPQTAQGQAQASGPSTVINNNTTTNNYGGPVQGRELAFKDPSVDTKKKLGIFKSWIEKSFEQQKQAAAQADAAFDAKDRALYKTGNKLLRMLEGLSNKLSNIFGGKNRTQRGSFQEQLKNLFKIFGLVVLVKNFDKLLTLVDGISSTIKGIFSKEGVSGKMSALETKIAKLFGAKEGEPITTSLKNFFIGEDGLWGRLKRHVSSALDERVDAILSLNRPEKWGVSNFGEGLQYLQQVFACALGGSKAAKRIAYREVLANVDDKERRQYGNNKEKDRYRVTYTDEKGNRINVNIEETKALYNDVLSSEYVRKDGSLVDNKFATIIQGRDIKTLMTETKSGTVHSLKILGGFQRLKEAAGLYGHSLVEDNFLDALVKLGVGTSREEVIKNLELEVEPYKVILTPYQGLDPTRARFDAKLVPKNRKLWANEREAYNNGEKAEQDFYKFTPKTFRRLEETLGIKFDISDKSSLDILSEKLTDIKHNVLSESLESKQIKQKTYDALVSNIKVDTEGNEAYSEAVRKVESLNAADEARKAELEYEDSNDRVARAGEAWKEEATAMKEKAKEKVERVKEIGHDLYYYSKDKMFKSLSTTPQVSGVSKPMVNQISKWETGHDFGLPLKEKDLSGYNLKDAGGHKTFGYGLLYHPSGKFMDEVQERYTQKELENLYLDRIEKKAETVKSWENKNSINLNQNQRDSLISATFNFGNGFLTNKGKPYTETVEMIKENPNNPKIPLKWEHISDAQGKDYPGLIDRRKMEAMWYADTNAREMMSGSVEEETKKEDTPSISPTVSPETSKKEPETEKEIKEETTVEVETNVEKDSEESSPKVEPDKIEDTKTTEEYNMPTVETNLNNTSRFEDQPGYSEDAEEEETTTTPESVESDKSESESTAPSVSIENSTSPSTSPVIPEVSTKVTPESVSSTKKTPLFKSIFGSKRTDLDLDKLITLKETELDSLASIVKIEAVKTSATSQSIDIVSHAISNASK